MAPTSPAKKKRRTSLPLPPERQALASSSFKKSARPPSSAAVAAAAAAKRKNDATQIAIAFESKTKYPVGMKILLSDRIYGSPSQVRVSGGFPFLNLSNNLLTFLLCCFWSQVPERARGHLFEYELLSICRTGASVKYCGRIYKPGAVSFQLFKDQGEEENIVLQSEALKDAHELWQVANGNVNSYLNDQIMALKVAAAAKTATAPSEAYTFEDLEAAFNKGGGGLNLLLMEYEPGDEGPVFYQTKRNTTNKYWVWRHRLTLHKVKRYASISGNTYDTGRLWSNLRKIDERRFPLAFARSKKILALTGKTVVANDETGVTQLFYLA